MLPSWLTAVASSGAAWVPQPQGWRVAAGSLWAAVLALPLVSLVMIVVVAYLVLHVSTSRPMTMYC